MSKTLTEQDIRDLTGNGGEWFRIGFTKRLDAPNKTQAALLDALKQGTMARDALGKRQSAAAEKLAEQGFVTLSETHVRLSLTPPTEGEYREMTCRFGVHKDLSEGPRGGTRAYDFEEKNVVVVWIPEQDRRPGGKDKGYRAVPCENVKLIKAHKRVWKVEDGVLVEQTDGQA